MPNLAPHRGEVGWSDARKMAYTAIAVIVTLVMMTLVLAPAENPPENEPTKTEVPQ